MDPQLRRPLYFVLALAATGVAAYAALKTDVALRSDSGEDGTADRLGGVALRLALGLAIAFGVRAIVRRAPAQRTFGSVSAACCCGALLALAWTGVLLDAKKGTRDDGAGAAVADARSQTEACIDQEGDPLRRARAPFDLTDFSAADREAALREQGLTSGRDLVRYRHAFRDGSLIGRVTATALRPGTGDADDYRALIRQQLAAAGATPRDERLAGRDAISGELRSGAVIAAEIDCGALVVEAGSRRDARALFTMISTG